MRYLLLVVSIVLFGCEPRQSVTPTHSSELIGLTRDTQSSDVILTIPKDLGQVIYYSGFSRGLGSNDIGIDRGLIGESKLVSFEAMGDRLLLREHNLRYRGTSDNAAENTAVDHAFPDYIMASFEILSEADSHWVIDASEFIVRDAFDVNRWLGSMDEGQFTVDAHRSGVYWENTKSFPENLELEAIVTFTGSANGGYLNDVLSNSEGFSLHLHHSFIKLPDSDYQARAYHPNSGYFVYEWEDYTKPLNHDLTERVITRHRLVKTDPNAPSSPVVEPIIYYLDPGVPEPVRTALIEGAMWWAEAFEAAGFEDAYRVEILPEGADPMDSRFNVINWVHRATRGWSYGASIIDPRTGEIIKGHVTLGSLRVRQDILIAEALLNDADSAEAQAMALARIRQLSAHEVGHTIGIAHNFAASESDRASVMDYPHPLITLDTDGNITLNDAYDEGIGLWDKLVVAYGYGDSPVQAISDIQNSGINYVSDRHARPVDGAFADGHLWDNHNDPTSEYRRLGDIRRKALSQLNQSALANGDIAARLDDLLVPLYNLPRYQADGVAKQIGGFNIQSSLVGEAQQLTPVPAQRQQQATLALIESISDEALAIQPELMQLLVPHPTGFNRTRESSPSQLAELADNTAMAEAYIRHVLQRLVAPNRLNRLVGASYSLEQHLDLVINMLEFDQARTSIAQRRDVISLRALFDSLDSSSLSEEAKTILWAKLVDLNEQTNVTSAHGKRMSSLLDGVSPPSASDAQMLPPGSPI